MMPSKPVWTYDVTSANGDIETLKIRKLLQKNSQPNLETLQRFDLQAAQTLLYLYKHNEKYQERINRRVEIYARGILNALLDETELSREDLDTLQIEPHLIHEPTTKLE
jgi:hypothetical protein